MYFVLTVIAFVVIFSVIVLIHELGHFVTARRNGVKVEEFGFGLPPKIWGIKRGGVLYSINLLPFGGFCKLLGEDSHDQKSLADPQSFGSKPLGVRAKIIVAGVLMNFILAILLLSIGFSIGIKPLMITSDDIFTNISNGTVETTSGVVIKSVEKASPAANAGFQDGDVIMQMNDKDITDISALEKIFEKLPAQWPAMKIRRGNSIMNVKFGGGTDLNSGITLYDAFFMPRVAIKNVAEKSEAAAAGVKAGDVIIKINGEQIYDLDRFTEALNESMHIDISLMRDYRIYNFAMNQPFRKSAIISSVLIDSLAEKAGFMKGDYILQVGEKIIMSPKQVIEAIKNYAGKKIEILVERNGAMVVIPIKPNLKGEIGLLISKVFYIGSNQITAYTDTVPTSILKINDVKYPVYKAVWASITESWRMAVFTVEMFGKLVRDVLGTLHVPESVSGPVGIAHMTYVFVKEGFSSVIRFAALLSLSLAVLNILPFPGLDGGRLLFIIAEGISGRKVNQKFESLTHFIGFILLLFLVLFVTYKDIISLF